VATESEEPSTGLERGPVRADPAWGVVDEETDGEIVASCHPRNQTLVQTTLGYRWCDPEQPPEDNVLSSTGHLHNAGTPAPPTLRRR